MKEDNKQGTKPANKKTSTNKQSTKPANKKTSTNKQNTKKTTEKTNLNKTTLKDLNKIEKEDKLENKIDINLYVNTLFKEKETEKKSSIRELIFLLILLVIVIISSFLIMNTNNNSKNKPKDNKQTTKKEEQVKEEVIDTDEIAVLTFHRITSEEVKNEYFKDNEWVQSVDMFEKQIEYLAENKYETLSMDEFYCWYKKKCKFSKKTVVLTFDDGDLSVYYMVIPILKKYNYKGTAFIVGSRTGETQDGEFNPVKRQFITKDIIEKTKEEYPNFEYQNHSYNFHDSEYKTKIYDMSEEQIQEDFDKMSEFNFEYMAYPFGNYDEKLLKKIKENNYKLGFTFRNYGYATRESNQYEIPRIKINGRSTVDTIKWVVGGDYIDE